jgi:hypothetical protein
LRAAFVSSPKKIVDEDEDQETEDQDRAESTDKQEDDL